MNIIPMWAWPMAGLLAWGWYGHHEARVLRDQVVTMKATDAAEVARAQAEAKRVQADQREVISTTEKQLAQSRATLTTADAAAARLRRRLASVPAPGGSAPAPGGPAAADLAGALGACVAEYRGMGEAAVAAAAAGERCAGLYDAVSARQPAGSGR